MKDIIKRARITSKAPKNPITKTDLAANILSAASIVVTFWTARLIFCLTQVVIASLQFKQPCFKT
jgi:hypothetical protein